MKKSSRPSGDHSGYLPPPDETCDRPALASGIRPVNVAPACQPCLIRDPAPVRREPALSATPSITAGRVPRIERLDHQLPDTPVESHALAI